MKNGSSVPPRQGLFFAPGWFRPAAALGRPKRRARLLMPSCAQRRYPTYDCCIWYTSAHFFLFRPRLFLNGSLPSGHNRITYRATKTHIAFTPAERPHVYSTSRLHALQCQVAESGIAKSGNRETSLSEAVCLIPSIRRVR